MKVIVYRVLEIFVLLLKEREEAEEDKWLNFRASVYL